MQAPQASSKSASAPNSSPLADTGIPATVTRVADVGRHTVVEATVGTHKVAAIQNGPAPQKGDEVHLHFTPEHTRLYADGWIATDARAKGERSMKTENQKAWFFVAPVLILVAFNAIIPMMTVVNYSVQETFGDNLFFWEGLTWFEQILRSERFHAALGRQFFFTAMILLIEIPLGIAIALSMPRKGFWVPVCLVLMALPMLIPWNVVGAMWNIFALPDIGLLGYFLNHVLGINYDMTQDPVAAWVTIITMDVWHWTSLVVLLSYAGLVSIPDAYYQAAKIDGATNWSVFRYIQLPKMKSVLTIAILLRFMDSFNIYTEPFVLTGGGPGNSTTLLSIDLVKIALGQFDLGPAAAMSLIYFAITLFVSWLFYTLMTKDDLN